MSKVSLAYHALDTFTKSYIEAAFWSSTQNKHDSDDTPLDKDYQPWSHLSMEALERMKADCEKFQSENAELLQQAGEVEGSEYIGVDVDDRAGYDFWMTRTGSGVGFWDRELGDVGDRLSAHAHAFGECWLVIGDDNKIYFM